MNCLASYRSGLVSFMLLCSFVPFISWPSVLKQEKDSFGEIFFPLFIFVLDCFLWCRKIYTKKIKSAYACYALLFHSFSWPHLPKKENTNGGLCKPLCLLSSLIPFIFLDHLYVRKGREKSVLLQKDLLVCIVLPAFISFHSDNF